MQELENAYRTLDLEPGASMEEINQAYKDLAFIWHPDRLPKDNLRLIEKAQEKIKQLNQARDYLRTHARVGASSAASPQGYRSRTRPYGRSAADTSYHARKPYAGYGSEGARSAYTPPNPPSASHYAQSSYGTYGSYGTRNGSTGSNGDPRSNGYGGTPQRDATREPLRERAYGNGTASGSHSGNPRPENATGNRAYSSNASGSTAQSPHVANDTGTGKAYNSPTSGRSPSPSGNDGWNNYSSYRATNGYGSAYRGSTAQPGTRSSDRPPAETTRRPPASYGESSYRSSHTQASPRTSTESSTSRPRQQNPDLSGANFRGANLREKDFSGRNLSSADLAGADLQDAFLHGVNLNRADLSNANLFRANLLQANLSHANLRGANLLGADLSGADLSGADLSGAKVAVGDRVMVKLTGTVLRGTIMPDGTINA